jgi:hypothetical protein
MPAQTDPTPLEYATPSQDKPARRQRLFAIIGLAICIALASAVVMSSGSLILNWTLIAHKRMGCGNPKANIRDGSIMLAVPFLLSVVCWVKSHLAIAGLLKSCSIISLIVAAVAWVAAMSWTHWY